MPRTRLAFTGWAYDDESRRIIAMFEDAPGPEEEDPLSFVPSKRFEVELLPRVLNEDAIEQPEQKQIESLNSAVDQLMIDMLMGGML